ncbi:MAG: ankyrin repeat domain-containing protein [Clostridiales bacterium]|nr:ankyrin repeat domain-containing protein [Clostridiales bacterium]
MLFIKACKEGNIERAKVLLEQGAADINERDTDGWTALMRASWDGRIDVVKFLIKKGAKNYKEAFVLAAENGQKSIVEFLIKYDFERLAAKKRPENVDYEKYTIIDRRDMNFYQTALMRAVDNPWKDNLDVVKVLLTKKYEYVFDKLIRDNFDEKLARQSAYKSVVDYINEIDNLGYTALMQAVYRGHSDIVKYLIEKGADIYKTTKGGHTALDLAICVSESPDIVKSIVVRMKAISTLFVDEVWESYKTSYINDKEKGSYYVSEKYEEDFGVKDPVSCRTKRQEDIYRILGSVIGRDVEKEICNFKSGIAKKVVEPMRKRKKDKCVDKELDKEKSKQPNISSGKERLVNM